MPASSLSAKRAPRSRSRVKTELERPYSVEFAIRSASSSPLGAQDRRDGAEELVPRDRVLVVDVAEHVRRKDQTVGLAAEDLWDPCGSRLFDVLAQVLHLGSVDDRAHHRVGLVRVAVL